MEFSPLGTLCFSLDGHSLQIQQDLVRPITNLNPLISYTCIIQVDYLHICLI
jgi:hypothetical protein